MSGSFNSLEKYFVSYGVVLTKFFNTKINTMYISEDRRDIKNSGHLCFP